MDNTSDTQNGLQGLLGFCLLGVLNIAMTLAAIWSHSFSDNLFLAIVTLQALLCLVAINIARHADPFHALAAVIAGGVIIRLILVIEPPLLSDDIYRYIWDGRVVNAGYNPFAHVPADPVLAPLRDADIWPHIDKKDYAVTIYPPVAQALFAIVTRIADGLYPMKLAMLTFEALGVAAMIALLGRLREGTAALALYLWHPFPAWEIANNGHADAAMMGLAFAGFAWCGYGRPYRLAATLTGAAMMKPFAALFLPSTWRPFDLRLPLFVIALVVLFYLPFLSAGAGVTGFLGRYFDEQGLSSGTGFFFVLMAYKLGATPIVLPFYLVICAAGLLALAISLAKRNVRGLRMRLGEAATLGMMSLIVLTPVFPWYFLLIAPFAVLLRSWCAFTMMTTGFWLYGFLPDQVEFLYRWSAAIILVLAAGSFDLWRWRQATPALGAR